MIPRKQPFYQPNSSLPDSNEAGSPLLSSSQQEAVFHKDGPLLITAGAGSGKTRTLTSRLRHLIEVHGILPDDIIAITFTNKAAAEMRNRLRGISGISSFSPFIGTFHSLGAQILRGHAQLLGRTNRFTIFDDNDSLQTIKRVLLDLDISKEQHSPASLQYSFSKIKSESVPPEDVFLKPHLRAAFTAYETSLREQNTFDFDDLIEKPVWIFEHHPDILQAYQKKFRYILVDEYQDINSAQYRFVRLLAEGHGNLSVVGDDNQAIYSFRGADFRNFLSFEKDWPTAKIVILGENYRSSGAIVTAAAAVIAHNKLQRPKELFTSNPHGELIKVVETTDPADEANYVMQEVLKRNKLSETAILYRTNAQSRALEQALSFYGVPYEIFGGLKFYERMEIKDIVACLRYGANPLDAVSRARIDKNFPKRVSRGLIAELPDRVHDLSPVEFIGFVLKTTEYLSLLKKKFKNAEERIENIDELIHFASSFKTLSEFLETAALSQDSERMDTAKRSVKLMTIHTAKGLEFDYIFLVGSAEGFLPHQKSLGSSDELEEERRLMYVGMTRARKHLTLTFYGLASRFLYEIPPELVEFESRGGYGPFHDEWPPNGGEDEVYLT